MSEPDNYIERIRPTHRRLQIFAFDPGQELDLETARINRAAIKVPWENLKPGPVGDYIEVVDVDPSSGCAYEPVDLECHELLASDGHFPSEGNPEFHQQMVYAVAMRTIENFERALGRTVHWSPRLKEGNTWLSPDKAYVPRLRIYPHALREANAYYSPDKKAVLFGYFNSDNSDARDGLPGGIVFGCLSHDIIAHEVTHAIVDGIHRRLLEGSNTDSLAFHEAFADLMAILQHFTLPGVLKSQIAKTRGDLSTENELAKLAGQFGYATRRGNALRDALGKKDEKTGIWMRDKPDPSRFEKTTEPHARGAIFVAAIFDAFLAVYSSRVADLRRIASGGTGILPQGDLHPDLVDRLADEAARISHHFMTICIRALDYLPPVDVTFGDYIRGLITSDVDLVNDDRRGYRIALIRAFRDRGIYPRDVRTLSVESLRWQRPKKDDQDLLRKLLPRVDMLRLMTYVTDYALVEGLSYPEIWKRGTPRERSDIQQLSDRMVRAYRNAEPALRDVLYETRRSTEPPAESATSIRRKNEFLNERQFAAYLHEYILAKAHELSPDERLRVTKLLGVNLFETEEKFEVHAVRPTIRRHRDGKTKHELLILITQRKIRTLGQGNDKQDDEDWGPLEYKFRGGCTLLIDPVTADVSYAITKNIDMETRLERQEEYLRERLRLEGLDALARNYLWRQGEKEDRTRQEPFRFLHRGPDWEEQW